jgi:uncharacterized membrane protein YeiB
LLGLSIFLFLFGTGRHMLLDDEKELGSSATMLLRISTDITMQD